MATDETASGAGGWWARQSRRARGILIGAGVVLLIAVIGNVFGRGEDVPPPEAEPDSPVPTEEPSVEVEPEPTSPATVEPEPAEEPESEPGQPSLAEYADEAMLAWHSPEGGPVATSWEELADTYTTVHSPSEVSFDERRILYGSSESWPAMVASVEDRTDTILQVNLRVHSQSPDWDQDEIGRFVANSFMTTIGPGREDLDYVLVYSSDGVEIGSLRRSDSNLTN